MENFTKLLSLAVIGFSLGLTGCSRPAASFATTSPCGTNAGTDKIEGLTWIAGSPSQANALCEVRQQQGRVLQSLEPDSRDPVLFRDDQLGWNFLVERFSGRQARPSRISWFSSEGQWLGQRGDWPQNVYSINLSPTGEALITGFDAGIVQSVRWQSENFAGLQSSVTDVASSGTQHPVHTLTQPSFWAVIDNGYDLIRYQPTDVKVSVYSNSPEQKLIRSGVVADPNTGAKCQNAFQVLPVSAAEVILSCNPQYYGPAAGTTVGLFKVTLKSDGQIASQQLIQFDGRQIQRIDLWGLDDSNSSAFVAYKTTQVDDYDGKVSQVGWLNLQTLVWTNEPRFSGPLHRLRNQTGVVVACAEERGACSKGSFVLLMGDQLQKLELQPQLPFLAFAQELKRK